MSFEDAKAKYPLGIMAGGPEIPVEDMSTSIEGRSYYRSEYAAGRKRHSKILYHFNGNHAITFLTSYALNTISTPTNIRHFERVGLDS